MTANANSRNVNDRIAEIIAPYLGLEGPAMPMLHAIQAAYGYVPEGAVPVVAQALNLSRAEVHGIVSFYHDFRHEPAGRRPARALGQTAWRRRPATVWAFPGTRPRPMGR